MCVIAFSEKGKDIPSVEQLKAMWKKNPDGAGYAFVGRDGEVFYRKGFMTLDSLLKELENPERFKNVNFAVHFRIGTSGKNDKHTCHPFPISTHYEDLRKMEGKEDAVLFHNGILSKGGIVADNSSDTQDFVVAMAPVLSKCSKSKARDYFINDMVSGSKLLILYRGNKFKMYGDWKKDGDLWVSNLYYKDDYSWTGYGYNKDWYDDWYESYYGKKTANTTYVEPNTGQRKTYDHEERLWADIIAKKYMFVTPLEIKALKETADGCNDEWLEYGGYTFGYDEEQELVWLESTPDDESPGPDNQGSLDLEGEEEDDKE